MIDNVEVCYGCTACAVACPQNAIEVKRDEKGFVKPILNSQRCVQCGICDGVCPGKDTVMWPLQQGECMAGYYMGVSRNSSSGGIAYAISEDAILQGKKVCGVVYNTESAGAEHVVVSEISRLEKVSGSKYLQSNPYPGMKSILKDPEGVIFGTPCQIAGLRNILRQRNTENRFLLVDIFCHGVPSELLWRNHLTNLEKKRGIDKHEEVSFRRKSEFCLDVGKYHRTAQVDPFYHLYLNRYVYAEACYQCPFRRNSAADVRLGDYFLKTGNPQSVILTLTGIGRRCVANLSAKNTINIQNTNYADIDRVQDKDKKMPIPELRAKYLDLLVEGKSPAEIMGKYKICVQYIKGFIKRILGKI